MCYANITIKHTHYNSIKSDGSVSRVMIFQIKVFDKDLHSNSKFQNYVGFNSF
jgi:hypothetical protein